MWPAGLSTKRSAHVSLAPMRMGKSAAMAIDRAAPSCV